MTQALNYAAAASAGLKDNLYLFGGIDRKMLIEMIEQIDRSVHFSVPDNGNIFDDGFKGLIGGEVNLPFPEITIEYFVTQAEVHPDLIQVPKRLVIASKVAVEDLRKKHRDNPLGMMKPPPEIKCEHVIQVLAACNFDQGFGWVPIAASYCILCKGWDEYTGHSLVKPIRDIDTIRNPGIAGFPTIYLPKAASFYVEKLGSVEVAVQHLCNDIGAEAAVTMELCEALTCSNVGITTIQKVKDSVNQRRAHDGKLPLYEVKALEITVPGKKEKQLAFGDAYEDRASPRQHLRRGHIRNLVDGRRIWISSCVVGSEGRVDKTYSVTMSH